MGGGGRREPSQAKGAGAHRTLFKGQPQESRVTVGQWLSTSSTATLQ